MIADHQSLLLYIVPSIEKQSYSQIDVSWSGKYHTFFIALSRERERRITHQMNCGNLELL